jgi:hypothetical protein
MMSMMVVLAPSLDQVGINEWTRCYYSDEQETAVEVASEAGKGGREHVDCV